MSQTLETITTRRATIADRDAIRAMQAMALRILGVGFYVGEQIEGFLAHVGTMDDFLLHEGTYYVAESGGKLAGSGGWSRQKPNYANATGPMDSEPGTPKIRSVFVHPSFARRGVATLLMQRAMSEATAAGCRTIGLTATLSGIPFYRSLGFTEVRRLNIHLPYRVTFPA